MDPLSLQAFEERAAAAEARLAAIESALKAGSATGASHEELVSLKGILVKAREEAVASQMEKDKMAARIKILEEENAKLKYRVAHLVKSVRDGDEALTRAKAEQA